MKKRYLIPGIGIFIAFIAMVAYSVILFLPHDPLEGSDQLVLVLSRTKTSPTAQLQFFNREGSTWKFAFSCPAVVGNNGMAWGRGLHRKVDRGEGDDVKREGDGTAPQGAFPLLHVYGYLPPSNMRINFPYTQSTEDLICCDDPKSTLYNTIFRIGEKNLDPDNLPSHEKMLRDDNLYKYAVFVGHNTWRIEKGAGSAIFLHVWRDKNSPTAGCTAMSESSILKLVSKLDIDKNPVLVQLTRKNYLRLKEEWGLPDVTI